MFLDFKKWVKSIQTPGYNNVRTNSPIIVIFLTSDFKKFVLNLVV